MAIEVHIPMNEYNKIVDIVKKMNVIVRDLRKEKGLNYELKDLSCNLIELKMKLLGQK